MAKVIAEIIIGEMVFINFYVVLNYKDLDFEVVLMIN